MDKIYKRDNTGATRVWWAEIQGGAYRFNSGQLNGTISTTEWTKAEGKNRGRSNQTSASEQAIAEVESHYAKKLKRGYTKTLKDIDQAKEKLIAPMLAHHYKDHCKKIKFPVYSQPKLDGIRCIIGPNGAFTRKGEPIKTVSHIEQMMVMLAIRLGITFDGELYNHDFHDDFNEIQSLITKKKVTPEQLARVKRLVQYHVYDLVDNSAAFSERLGRLRDIIRREISDDCEYIVLVHTVHCGTPALLDTLYGEYQEQGFEGQMIRANTPYERKRTTSLLKRKEFEDAEFEIEGIVEGKGNKSGMVGAICFTSRSGKKFSAALMGSNAYRRRIWKEHQHSPFTGVDATVRYQNLTPDGVPRFPRVRSIDEGK